VLNLALAAAVVCLSAFLIARAAGARSAIDLVLVGYVAAGLEIVALILFLSLFGAVRAGTLWVGLVVVLAGAALAARATSAEVRVRRPMPRLPRRPTGVEAVLGVAVVVSFAYSAVLALATPPNTWDSLVYHLTRVAFWHQEHGVGYVADAYYAPINGHPPVAEILMLFAVELAGGERSAAVVQLVAGAVAAVGVVGIARRIGSSRAESCFGAGLFLLLPIVALQTGTTQNDLVVASFLVIAAYAALGATRLDLGLLAGVLALGVGTKLTALFALPVLAALVLLSSERRERGRRLAAIAVGTTAGAFWYVVNVVRTGNLLGQLPDRLSAVTLFDPRANATGAANLLLDAFDLSGAEGTAVRAYGVVAVVVVIVLVAVRGKRELGTSIAAGVAALAPFLLFPASYVVWRGYQVLIDVLGTPVVPFDDDQWKIGRLASDSYSWYGPLGLILCSGTLGLAVVGVRRGRLPRVALVLGIAPLAWLAMLALTVVYDPFRGRFFIFPVALSAALWGLVLRSRALAPAAVAIGATTVALCFFHFFEKPSGITIGDGPDWRTIWGRERWDAETVTRMEMADVLRYAERQIPAAAAVALAIDGDEFGYPVFGPRLRRSVELTPRGTARAGAAAQWLFADEARRPDVDLRCWRPVIAKPLGWAVYRRTRPGCSSKP